jgi:hypothetical protein
MGLTRIKGEVFLKRMLRNASKLELLKYEVINDYTTFIEPYRSQMYRLGNNLEGLQDFPSLEMIELICSLLREFLRGRRERHLPCPIQEIVGDLLTVAKSGFDARIQSELATHRSDLLNLISRRRDALSMR